LLKISHGVAQFDELSLPHGFSTMSLGNMAHSWGEEAEVDRNAEAFYTETGLSRENRVHMLPQHKDNVVFVDKDDAGRAIDCDVLVTKSSGLTLSVLPADCLPIIIKSTDESWPYVALVHAGWKGTHKMVVRAAVMFILAHGFVTQNMLPVFTKDLVVYIGPGIELCCYKPSRISKMRGAKTDLIAENVRQLLGCGIKEENITIADTCTYCSMGENENELFFSHQRAKRTKEREGRFVAAVALK